MAKVKQSVKVKAVMGTLLIMLVSGSVNLVDDMKL